MKILISGTGSGLGRLFHEYFNSYKYDRFSSLPINEHYDVIIHCAINSAKTVFNNQLDKYLNDNVLLTQQLLTIPCNKFIYISTIDVYPKLNKSWNEEDIIEYSAHDTGLGMYTVTKMLSESLVIKHHDYNILRLSSMLHPHSRTNTITRIINEVAPKVYVNEQSEYNCVLGSDIIRLTDLLIHSNIKNTVLNVVSSLNIKISEIAQIFGKVVSYGDYSYTSGKIENKKLIAVAPFMDKTSQAVLAQYKEQVLNEAFIS
jgi:nucleoside-diphosphate-sugar epimerase